MKEESSQTVGEKIEETVKTAEETIRKPFVKKLARFGFYTKAFLFIVIGVLAAMVAIGQKGGELADPVGALSRIAQLDYGKVLLIIFIIGAIGHGSWNILRGVADVDGAGKNWKGIFMRSIAVGVGIFYFCLAWSASDLLIFDEISEQTGEIQKTLAMILLALPLGTILAFLIGLGIIGAGFSEAYSGITGKYQQNFRLFTLSGKERAFVTVLGILSFTARAVLLVLVGYFFVRAAVYYNPDQAEGFDKALAVLADTYYGKTLLFITSIGLICHGILSLYEARFRRIY
jgi:uncharacterized membrane protein